MIINYVLILITLLLISGLVLDAGLLEWRQLHLQIAADAAAQEAMTQLARGDSNWSSEGQAQSTFNGFTNGSNGVTVSIVHPPVSGTYSGNTLAVQATVSQSVSNFFMEFVNASKSTVAATAVGVEIPTCIWIMNPAPTSSSNGAFRLSSTGVTANCGFYSNAATGINIVVDGFSSLGTLRTRLVGTAANNGSTGYVSPKPIYNAATKNDPLAYVTAPTVTSCSATATALSGVTYTINPGTYCGGTTISNSSVITMTAGTYIFADGLTISSSTISGTAGVTIYLTKKNSSSYVNVSITSSTLSLKAPTSNSSGGIPGVLVFGDRNWIAHGSQGISIQNSTVTADGAWYVLNTGMTFSNNTFNRYKYDIWVIDNFYQYLGHSYFGSDFSDFTNSISPLHYEDGVLAQ